jgi:hypothetical protein
MLKIQISFGRVLVMEQLMLINQRLLVPSAGFQATNAYNSTFIGKSAGSGAITLTIQISLVDELGKKQQMLVFRHLLVNG